MLGKILHKDSLHHAYILYGQKDFVHENICNFCEKLLGISVNGNPDFMIIDQDVLAIDTVRTLTSSAQKRGLGEKKIYVIHTRNMTRESQNALLKILEEPQENTHFFIVIGERGLVIPTLQSRVIEFDIKEKDSQHSDVIDFAKASLQERMKIVDEIAKEKDRARASSLIHGILEDRERLQINPAALKALAIGSKYINLPSSSVKMILENIALKI